MAYSFRSFESEQNDNRYFPRWEVTNRVFFQVEGSLHTTEAKTVDLSCSGACIKTTQEIESGTKVQMNITLSIDHFIKVEGEVLWCKQIDEEYFVGVQFQNISQDAQEMILEFAFELDKDGVVNHWFKGWEGTE